MRRAGRVDLQAHQYSHLRTWLQVFEVSGSK
jgi:hypothetical protein